MQLRNQRWPEILKWTAVLIAATGLGLAPAPRRPLVPALTRRQRIRLALDRLTWGPRPGDIRRVEALGLQKWIALELHPGRIRQNPRLRRQLRLLTTLRMSPRQLLRRYPPPQFIKQMALGRRPLPSDPAVRARVQVQIARLRRQIAQKNLSPAAIQAARKLRLLRRGRRLRALLGSQFAALTHAPWPRRAAVYEQLPAPVRRKVIALLPRGQALQLALWLPLPQSRAIEQLKAPMMVPVTDLQQAKMLRAIYGTRQLQDVLTDFWFNHFNVYLYKGADRYFTTQYAEQVIRPHVLGHFYTLLLATAKSPAMLFYLDNWRSVAPGAGARLAAFRARMQARRRAHMARMGIMAGFLPASRPAPRRKVNPPGINENYGRELMELHTLGVNGGYTQRDVDQVALCLTGWTIRTPFRNPAFFFAPRLHARRPKTVLGRPIDAGGEQDGIAVLKLLANNPATARHISYELAQRFVSDHPPHALVDRMVAVWLRSHGDLRQVMAAMIAAPQFWSPRYAGDKFKAPLQMVASAVRAVQARVYNPEHLVQVVAQMGEPLYLDLTPNGYSTRNPDWISSTGLVDRMNFALALGAGWVPGLRMTMPVLPSAAEASRAAALIALAHVLEQPAPAPAVEKNMLVSLRRLPRPAGAGWRSFASSRPLSGFSPAQEKLSLGLLLGAPGFQHY